MLIKRAALGNLKASFHCTQRLFRKPTFNSLYDPFGSPYRDRNLPYLFSKTYPSFLPLKEGSTFLTKPLFPQGREDVAGSAIVPSGFGSASGACAHKGLTGSAYATELRLFVGWGKTCLLYLSFIQLAIALYCYQA